jgi:hypothetical protein
VAAPIHQQRGGQEDGDLVGDGDRDQHRFPPTPPDPGGLEGRELGSGTLVGTYQR